MKSDDKKERINFLKNKCKECAKEGTYLCKKLFNKNNECMFFEEYDETKNDCFGDYY